MFVLVIFVIEVHLILISTCHIINTEYYFQVCFIFVVLASYEIITKISSFTVVSVVSNKVAAQSINYALGQGLLG